jgi:hypothetical protein
MQFSDFENFRYRVKRLEISGQSAAKLLSIKLKEKVQRLDGFG